MKCSMFNVIGMLVNNTVPGIQLHEVENVECTDFTFSCVIFIQTSALILILLKVKPYIEHLDRSEFLLGISC